MHGVTRAAEIPDDIESLKRLVLEQQVLIEERQLEIERLRLAIARLRRERYGRSSEALDQQIEQMELTLEEIEETHAALSTHLAAVKAAPEKPVRQALPPHLLRESNIHEAPVAPGCTCPDCGGALREMEADVTEVMERIPERFMVVRHVRPKFSCGRCEKIIQAPAAKRPFANGMAGASVIAHVFVSKFCDHTPLYRQAQIYARDGVEIPRSTQSEWVGQATTLLNPLVQAVVRYVLGGTKVHGDDTPVPVLCPGRGTTKMGRLWVYVRDDRNSGDKSPPAVAFRYSPDRKAIYPNKHLESFSGVLQADAYAGYNGLYNRSVNPVLEAACFAHCPESDLIWSGCPDTAEILLPNLRVAPDNSRCRIKGMRGRQAHRASVTKGVLATERVLIAARSTPKRCASSAGSLRRSDWSCRCWRVPSSLG